MYNFKCGRTRKDIDKFRLCFSAFLFGLTGLVIRATHPDHLVHPRTYILRVLDPILTMHQVVEILSDSTRLNYVLESIINYT